MSGWKVEPTKRVYLPEDIADDLWLAIYHPKLMPYEPMQKFLSLAPALTEKEDVAGFDLASARDLATTMILEWNLPDENGQVLPIPSKDEKVWDKVPPMPVIMAIFEAMGEGVVQGEPDPNSSDGSASS